MNPLWNEIEVFYKPLKNNKEEEIKSNLKKVN